MRLILSTKIIHRFQLLLIYIAFFTEWWHYYLPNTTAYELLDIDFKKLKILNKKKHAY